MASDGRLWHAYCVYRGAATYAADDTRRSYRRLLLDHAPRFAPLRRASPHPALLRSYLLAAPLPSFPHPFPTLPPPRPPAFRIPLLAPLLPPTMGPAFPLFRAVVAAAVAAVAVAAAAAAPSAAAPAAAECSCASLPPIVESVAASPHTVLARVTGIIRSPVPAPGEEGEKVYTATVGSSFVGCTLRHIMVSTAAPTDVGGCSATLAVGKKYLLFLPEMDHKGNYRVSPCGPQREWEAVGAADRHMLWGVNQMVCPRAKRVVLGLPR